MNRKFTVIIAAAILFLTAAATFSQEPGSVKGIVRTPEGTKLTNVKVTARLDGNEKQSTETDKNGEFKISGLAPGTYRFVFEKNGYAEGVIHNVIVKSKKVNNLKDRVILTVDQGSLVIVAGSVFDQVGRSVYGAKIRIQEIDESGKAVNAGEAYSSQSGEFIFRYKPGAKAYKVTARLKDAEASKTIDVSDPAIYRLALTLNFPAKN